MAITEPIPVADALKALRMAQQAIDAAQSEPWTAVWAEQGGTEQLRFIRCAHAVLPGMVEYMLWRMSISSSRFVDDYIEAAIAPIVAWARTREEWSR